MYVALIGPLTASFCCPDADTASTIVVMYVVRVPNRGSPPAILLRESYREAGKVKNRTLANLSSWPQISGKGCALWVKCRAVG